MSNIDINSNIKRYKLDELNYLRSLLDEAYNIGLLNENDLDNIQIQLLELLDTIVYKYNGIDSSSIRKEILENISNSNIYTIGLYLKTFRIPDEAIKVIKEKGIKYVYLEGRKRIEKILKVIRIFYSKVLNNKNNVGNIIYDNTVIGGISGFLKIYNPDYDAQDMKITADYPTFINYIGMYEGVEFIEKYVYAIYLENEFCKIFDDEKVRCLLYTFSSGYKDLILNIFEIVLLEVFACKLVDRDVKDLIINNLELNKIYDLLKEKSKEEIQVCIQSIFDEINDELLSDNKELQEYIQQNLDYIINLIITLLESENLDKIFITEKYILNIS